jgi:hypothetical protein
MTSLELEWSRPCLGWHVGAVSQRRRFSTSLGGQRPTGWLSKTPVAIVLVRTGEVVAIKPNGTPMTEQELKALGSEIADQIQSRA